VAMPSASGSKRKFVNCIKSSHVPEVSSSGEWSETRGRQGDCGAVPNAP
jgi:hypothetical protein